MPAKSLAVYLLYIVSIAAAEWTPTRIIAIDYPLLGVQSTTSGIVRLECELREDGTVQDARVVSGPLMLGRHVLGRVLSWRFRNERNHAQGGRRFAFLTFNFKLGEIAPGPPKSQFVYDYPNEFTITATRMQRTH